MKHFNQMRPSKLMAAFTLTALTLAGNFAQADDSGWAYKGDHDGKRDSVVLTFSTVGDSRQDPVNPDPSQLPVSGQDSIWLQNTKALERIKRSVEMQNANFLFFNGDMIMGYGNATSPADTNIDTVVNSDLMQFYREYGFWRGMMAGLMEGGTYVIPVPGNHELQWKKGGKKTQVVNENAWRANMGDLILDTNRFEYLFGDDATNINTADNGPLDGLTSDQSQLSYSFDFRGCHFAVINTDPYGDDSHAPVNWLNTDFAAAQARGIQHFFVFGHKPAFTYYFGDNLPDKPAGLDKDPTSRDAFWNVIEQYHATYFCGHEHIYHMDQPWAANGGNAWQVLVGSGGSPFEAVPTDATINPATDRDYAWATVTVFRSGKVRITVYGFDDQFGPTKVLKSVTLK